MKIVIGVTTYGNQEREIGFLKSYHNNIENSEHQVQLVCVDDGTPNPARVRERETAVRRLHADFISHGTNRGIPASWNSLLHYAVDKKADLIGIFNDDLRFLSPGWLTRACYFFEHNENVGMLGFPLVQERGFDDSDPRFSGLVGLVGAAVGCSFMVRPEVALLPENPDGTRGFWEDLISFHEECEEGFALARLGYYSFMLPWPALWHMGGQTFGSNPELVWRKPSPYLPMDEFLRYVRALPWYVPQYETTYQGGTVDRMSFSRGMFAKKYGILEMPQVVDIDEDQKEVRIWENPQIWAHHLSVPKKLNRLVFWLDKAGQQRSCEV